MFPPTASGPAVPGRTDATARKGREAMRRLFVLVMGLGLLAPTVGCYYVKHNFIAGKCDCDPPQGYTLGYTGGYGPVSAPDAAGPGRVMPPADH